MDYDVISNFTFNFTFDSDLEPEESMSMIFHEIIFSIICLAGIIADGLIVYVINRFRNMKNSINGYITNWLISDAIYLLLTPCFYRIFSALEDRFIGVELVCISFELASVLQITSVMFVTILCANWYLAVLTIQFRRIYKYIIATVWSITFSAMITLSSYCVQQQYSLFSHYLLFFGYAILMCIVISIHMTKYFTRDNEVHEKLTLILTTVSVYVICWFPSWLCLLAASVIEDYFVLYYLSIGAACLGYLNPLANLYVFSRLNKRFRMGLMQIFRCVQSDYNDASSFEDSDEDEEFNRVQDTPVNESIVDMSLVYNQL